MYVSHDDALWLTVLYLISSPWCGPCQVLWIINRCFLGELVWGPRYYFQRALECHWCADSKPPLLFLLDKLAHGCVWVHTSLLKIYLRLLYFQMAVSIHVRMTWGLMLIAVLGWGVQKCRRIRFKCNCSLGTTVYAKGKWPCCTVVGFYSFVFFFLEVQLSL